MTGKKRLTTIYETGKSPEDIVNSVSRVSGANAINATNTTLRNFTGDNCIDCGQPIIDGSALWWKGKDRVCRSCWKTRKLKEEHPAYAEDPSLNDVGSEDLDSDEDEEAN